MLRRVLSLFGCLMFFAVCRGDLSNAIGGCFIGFAALQFALLLLLKKRLKLDCCAGKPTPKGSLAALGYLRKYLITALVVVQPVLAIADCKHPTSTDPLPSCSYSAVNDNCSVAINRMNPVTPPTVYVHRGCSVRVTVINPSPLETLTLDWKSSTAVVPPDVFQTVFTALSPNLGKLTVVPPLPGRAAEVTGCEVSSTGCTTSPDRISEAQQRVQDSVVNIPAFASNATTAVNLVKDALQPPLVGQPGYVYPWQNFQAWKESIVAPLGTAIAAVNLDDLRGKVSLLNLEVTAYKQAASSDSDQVNAARLVANQAIVQGAFDALVALVGKLQGLKDAISGLTANNTALPDNSLISDPTPNDKNYEAQSWNINYANSLLPIAKRVSAGTLQSQTAATLGALADASPKQTLVTIAVQFESPSRVETSAGFMLPTTPYHSFSKAAVATNGKVTDNIVQQTTTYTVIPAVFVNVRAKEWIARKQPIAILVTGAVGYNPSTSSVEFGAPGLTLSYRFIALSALLDIGRDTKLAGGFTVGQSLGLSNPSSPLTTTYWSLRAAVAVSIRLPLGGSPSGK